jgi:hypothetical protein
MWSLFETKAPAKTQEVTLMRPIHANLLQKGQSLYVITHLLKAHWTHPQLNMNLVSPPSNHPQPHRRRKLAKNKHPCVMNCPSVATNSPGSHVDEDVTSMKHQGGHTCQHLAPDVSGPMREACFGLALATPAARGARCVDQGPHRDNPCSTPDVDIFEMHFQASTTRPPRVNDC